MRHTLLQVWCMLYSANIDQCANTKKCLLLIYTHTMIRRLSTCRFNTTVVHPFRQIEWAVPIFSPPVACVTITLEMPLNSSIYANIALGLRSD